MKYLNRNKTTVILAIFLSIFLVLSFSSCCLDTDDDDDSSSSSSSSSSSNDSTEEETTEEDSSESGSDDEGSGDEGSNPGSAGDISFTLVWSWSGSSDPEGPDIDIWVKNPDGEKLSASRDGYGLGPDSYGGEIDFDDQGQTSDHPGDGGGPERCYWPTGSAPSGTYTYGINYYAGTGTASYTFKVYKGSSLETTKTGSISSGNNTLGTVSNN